MGQTIYPMAREDGENHLFVLIDKNDDGYLFRTVSDRENTQSIAFDLPFSLSLDDQMTVIQVLSDLDFEEDIDDLKAAIIAALVSLCDEGIGALNDFIEGGDLLSGDVLDEMLQSHAGNFWNE